MEIHDIPTAVPSTAALSGKERKGYFKGYQAAAEYVLDRVEAGVELPELRRVVKSIIECQQATRSWK